MRKLVSPLLATALCALTLSLTSAPQAHAQTTPKVVAQATADAQPFFVLAFHDTDQGTQLDAQNFIKLFAGSQWTIMDDGTLTVKSTDGTFAVTTGYVTNQSESLFVPHRRGANTTVDGEIVRDPRNLSDGEAIVFITVPAVDQNN